MKIKKCSKCKLMLPVVEFAKHKQTFDGLQAYCKKCMKLYDKKRYDRKYRNSPEYTEKIRAGNLLRLYNLSVEEYNILYEQQNGRCAICNKFEMGKNQYGARRLSVDHNHKTGKVRGLLCSRCNLTLGRFENDAESLLEMYKYLKREYMSLLKHKNGQ